MARVDEAVGEQRDDELDASITCRWNGKPHRRDDCDTHSRQGNATHTRVRPAGKGTVPSLTVEIMPQPWTTSASASMAGADGIVTLVERARRSGSSRGGEIDPAHPQGLFFRDTRFIPELKLYVNDAEPLAATTTDPFSAVFVLRGHPSRGAPTRIVAELLDSALVPHS